MAQNNKAVASDVGLYNSMLDSDAVPLDQAESFIKGEMTARGVHPDTQTYTILIQRSRTWSEALHWFRKFQPE